MKLANHGGRAVLVFDDSIADVHEVSSGRFGPDPMRVYDDWPAFVDFAAGVTERYGEETQVSAFDGVTTQLTEMDALVAYLQILGRLTNAAYENTAAPEEKPDPES